MTVDRHHQFVTLDGLRGLAAIGVAVLHMPKVFGGFTVPNAHLAVDFFLQLSGFVIAYAYSTRILNGMYFRQFLWLRINRLYPAFVLGIGLGFAVAVAALLNPNSGLSVIWTPASLACSTIQNAFMLPAFGCGQQEVIFPLNVPMWSVFHEILVNVAFFALVSFIFRGRRILSIIVFLFVIVAPYGFIRGTFDFGYGWNDLLQGFVRVSASFFVGAAIFKFKLVEGRRSNVASAIAFSLLAAALFLQVKNVGYELFAIVGLFPVVLFVGQANPSNVAFFWVCAQLGKTSYVLYAIHKPLYQLAYGALLKLSPTLADSCGISLGCAMLASIVLIAWLLAVFFEPPARAAMNRLRWRACFSRSAASPP
jgi:peptidoglycan/LPS O-acetylase OafA/YrhL